MGANLAEEILKTGTFQTPEAWKGGQALLEFARRSPNEPSGWYAALADADAESIIAAIGGLGRGERHPMAHEAYREAARAMVEHNVAERTIAEMRRLERIGVFLAGVGIAVALPSTVIAVLRLWEVFR